eukprot:693125-Rhodomonas_salina.1
MPCAITWSHFLAGTSRARRFERRVAYCADPRTPKTNGSVSTCLTLDLQSGLSRVALSAAAY